MLTISRRIGESLMVGPTVSVTLTGIRGIEAHVEVGHPVTVEVGFTPHVLPPRLPQPGIRPRQVLRSEDRALPMIDLQHERHTKLWISESMGLACDTLVKVHVLRVGSRRVLFGIDAPRSLIVLRREAWLEQLCQQLYDRTRTLEALLKEVTPAIADFVRMAS